MTHKPSTPNPPLKPAVLHILLALTKGELHGLAIADQAAAASGGAVRLGPGTLYRSLDDMKSQGLVENVALRRGDDPRRKNYRITGEGRRVLRIEMGRLARLVTYARDRDLLPEGT